MTSLIGQKVSHYKVLEHLGRGGMGVVYMAQDLTLDRKVALKFLPPELTQDPDARERFFQEAKAASALDHNNICVIHEIGETSEGQFFIVMAYYKGWTLKERIEQGPAKTEEAVDIALQVAEGLEKAHEQGIVHRDIKPANVMLTERGIAKILDFGLAKLAGTSKLTKTRSTMGTVAYMSPEQARGDPVDSRADIWSLGVLLYETVTGRLPFSGDYEQALIYRILNEAPEPLPPSTGPRTEELQRILRRCLEKDPTDRYQRASDLIADLSLLKGELASGGPETGPQGTLSTTTRRRRILRIAVPALLLGVVAYFFVVHLITPPREETVSPATAEWASSVAVLPFRDFSQGKDQEYFCDGMTDAIIDMLTQVDQLKVISLTSVMRYKDTRKDVREIGSELGTANILEGSVQREADRIRIRAQLIQAEDGTHLWSQTYDRDVESVFDIQDQISRSIAEALKVVFEPESPWIPGHLQPKNLDAYEYYMKGMHFIKSKYVVSFEDEDYQAAVTMFQRAIEIDSQYASAYFGLAWAYEFHYHITRDPEDGRLMQVNGEKAWSLDPHSAIANATMGYACYEYREDRERAFEFFREALKINPNVGEVNFLLGVCYLYHGLYESGIRYLSRAMELDPFYFWVPYKLAFCLMHSGQYDEAATYFEKYFELAPIEPLFFPGQYVALNIWRGRPDLADSILTREERLNPEVRWTRQYRAILLAQRGDRDGALALYRNSEVYALLGMNAQATRELEREIRGTVSYPYIYYMDLLNNPHYASLRSDPRFQEILQREKELFDEQMKMFGNLSE